MKLLRLFISTVFISSTFIANAQKGDWCASDQMLESYFDANPEMRAAAINERVEQLKNQGRLSINKINGKIIIPTVVHVIHYNGIGNISKAQIIDGIRIINEDFSKLNADTSAVRNVFKPYIANAGIEFRLARLDENGNCTEGITRNNSYITFNKRNEPKSLVSWNTSSLRYYMNVWIVNSISGGGTGTILGFAQFPGFTQGVRSTYGVVVRADEWGSIEAAQNNDGRTVTHEMGHAINLLHTFQGSCGSSCQNTGDFVCDTPPQFDDNNNSCSFSLNTCSNDALGGIASNPNPYNSNVPDQLENYMGYGLNCLGMFTDGQKRRMLAAINGATRIAPIADTANATLTGTNDGYTAAPCIPTPEILAFDRFVCQGGTITFSEESYGGPITSYSWSFPGGTPSTSTQSSPTITYNTGGNFDVVLRVSNSSGTDSIVLSNYVHVTDSNSRYSAFNYVEGFENASSFANDWVVINEQVTAGDPEWQRATFASKNGSASLWINNLSGSYVSGKDKVISPTLKMTDVLNPSIVFDVAYRRRTSTSNDKLNLLYSVDCGATWTIILSTTPAFFAYDNNSQTNNFFPTQGNQWRTVTIPSQFIPALVKNSDAVKFMIELEHGDGNNMYLDDFRINGQTVGIEEERSLEENLTVYPNPAEDIVNLTFLPKQSGQVEINIQDLVGKKLKSVFSGKMNSTEYKFQINLDEFSKGVYFITVETAGEIATKKLIVQ